MALSIQIKRIGDWDKAQQLLSPRSQLRFQAALVMAVQQEAQFARKKIVTGIRRQAPAGRRFAPLKASTLAKRKFMGFRGRKALAVRGDLRNSIIVKRVGTGAFIGILKTAVSKDGKKLANVGRVHEEGRLIIMKITPKMRTFLAALSRETAGVRDKSTDTPKIGTPGVLVIRVPKRPFLAPVFKRFFKPAKVRTRLLGRLTVILKSRYGFVSGAVGAV